VKGPIAMVHLKHFNPLLIFTIIVQTNTCHLLTSLNI
jgi:hypothetical protein